MALTQCKECKNEISTKADSCPKCGMKIKRTSLLAKIVLSFILLSVFVMIFDDKNDSASPQPSPAVTQLNQIDLSYKWGKSGFGVVMMMSGEIKNNGPTDVKDLTISCKSSGDSGTVIDANKKILYQLVPAGKTIKFKDFNMGFLNNQASSSSCLISEFQPN